MKKTLIALALLPSIVFSGSEDLTTTEKMFPFPLQGSIETTADLYSAYVSRGAVSTEHPVFQPGITASLSLHEAGSVQAIAWGNFDLTDHAGHTAGAGLNEVNYSLEYTLPTEWIGATIGHTWYVFPRANGQDYGNSTEEVYLHLCYENEIATPSVTLYREYGLINGTYAELGLNKEWDLTEGLVLGTDIIIGVGDGTYLKEYFGPEANAGLNDITADLYLHYALTEQISLCAKIAWTSVLQNDTRDGNINEANDILWGGLSLTIAL